MAIKPINHYSFSNVTPSVIDEEGLTSLELVGRIGAKLNEAIEAYNKLEVNTTGKLNAQDLAIQIMNDHTMPDLVRDTVTEYIHEGEFDRAINVYLGDLETRLDNLLGSMATGSTTMDAEIIDARIDAYGKTHANLGAAIRSLKGHFSSLTTPGVDLNKVVEPDMYTIGVTDAANRPDDITSGLLKVESFSGGRWILQTCFRVINNPGNNLNKLQYYFRMGTNVDSATINKNFQEGLNVSWCEWVNISPYLNYVNIKESGTDLNTLVNNNNYVIQITDALNKPAQITTGFTLKCENYFPYVTQTATDLIGNRYYRMGQYAGSKTYWTEWTEYLTREDAINIINNSSATPSNKGYKIVNFGDSITDFEKDGTSVSGFLSEFTGATCYNVGFGGCRMSYHSSEDYAPFSMCCLADAIITGDFSTQEYAANKVGMPSTFKTRVETLKSIDFNDVDIITIAYGTNDFTASVPIQNDATYDSETFYGSLKYSIEKISEHYPNIRIVIIGITYRYWLDEDGIYNVDSNSYTNDDGVLLSAYNECLYNMAYDYQLPFVECYSKMGINRYNYPIWFRPGDGTHPSSNGQRLYAKLIAQTIKSL